MTMFGEIDIEDFIYLQTCKVFLQEVMIFIDMVRKQHDL